MVISARLRRHLPCGRYVRSDERATHDDWEAEHYIRVVCEGAAAAAREAGIQNRDMIAF